MNVVPDLSAELWNLSRYGNIPAARAVQQRIARVAGVRGGGSSGWVQDRCVAVWALPAIPGVSPAGSGARRSAPACG